MWRLITFSIIILLSGCSLVTIDDPVEMPNEQVASEQAQEKSKEPTIQAATVLEQESEQEQFIQILENVFHIDWSTKKNDDAKPLHFLALGDSLTRGIGDELKQSGYAGRLVEKLEMWPAISDVELDNRGKNGRRSTKVLELLKRGHYDAELAEADLLTMTIGGNDVMKVVKSDIFSLKKEMFDAERIPFAERYAQIIQEVRLRNKDVPIILIGFYNPFSIVTDEFTPFETIIDEWNEEMRKVAASDANACYVPIEALFSSNEDLVYHTDFFHPNATGYERMTEQIIETMVQCDIETMTDGFIGFEEGIYE